MRIIGGLIAFAAITLFQIAVTVAIFMIGMVGAEAGGLGDNLQIALGLVSSIAFFFITEWGLKSTRLQFLRLSQNPILHLNI